MLAATVLVGYANPRETAPALVFAYTCAYAVGAVVSYVVLAVRLRGLQTARLAWFCLRLLVVAGTATLAAFVVLAVAAPLYADGSPGKLLTLAHMMVIGLVDLAVLVILSVLLRLKEVTEVFDLFTRRLLRRRG